jgi:cysteine desulfurase
MEPSLPPPPAVGLAAPVRPAQIYLDSAASAPIDPAVTAKMVDVQGRFGANPASVHKAGLRAAREVELARMRIAARLGCPPETLTFTGCATEANNLALKGALWASPPDRRHLIVSAIEHPSVLGVARWLEQTGQARLTVLPVNAEGRVLPEVLDRALAPDTALVSVMHANNEVGTIQPLAALGQLCRERGVLLHTDACQSFLKVPIDLATMPVDLLSINAHKVHGPKGVGALYIRPGVTLTPLLHGGGHENGLRAGTLNVPGIAGFGQAVERFTADELARIVRLRVHLLGRLVRQLPQHRRNSPDTDALCNIVNVDIPGHNGKTLFQALDRRGIRVSSSSACHSTKLTPSPVLLAMGLDAPTADRALRISLGRLNTIDEVDALMDALVEIVAHAPPGVP